MVRYPFICISLIAVIVEWLTRHLCVFIGENGLKHCPFENCIVCSYYGDLRYFYRFWIQVPYQMCIAPTIFPVFGSSFHFTNSIFKFIFYPHPRTCCLLVLEGGRGREGRGKHRCERETPIGLPLVRAPTGDRGCSPGVRPDRKKPSASRRTGRRCGQLATRPGRCCFFKNKSFSI